MLPFAATFFCQLMPPFRSPPIDLPPIDSPVIDPSPPNGQQTMDGTVSLAGTIVADSTLAEGEPPPPQA